jgi:hypothetical protein
MNLSEKSRFKKRRNKIWISNKFNKENKSRRKNGKIIPIKEKCLACGNKTKFHHIYCEKCWKKKHKETKE